MLQGRGFLRAGNKISRFLGFGIRTDIPNEWVNEWVSDFKNQAQH